MKVLSNVRLSSFARRMERLALTREVAGLIQTVVITLGVLGGGAWALFTFGALAQTEKAKAELLKVQREAQQQAVIQISLSANQIANSKAGEPVVIVSLTIENKGNRNTLLEFERPTIKAFSVAPDSRGFHVFEPVSNTYAYGYSHDTKTAASGATVLAGETIKFELLLTLPTAGLYNFRFSSQGSVQDYMVYDEVQRKSGHRRSTYSSYGQSTYFVAR